MKRVALEWSLEYAKQAYLLYSKVESFHDRFRNLVPLYIVLGTGYFYLGTTFPYSWNDGHMLFYIPFFLGLVGLLVSISLLLYGMFWRSEVAVMPGPMDVHQMCGKFDEKHTDEDVVSFLNENAAENFSSNAQKNILNIKARSEILVTAGRIGVMSFIALFLSSFRYISTIIYQS